MKRMNLLKRTLAFLLAAMLVVAAAPSAELSAAEQNSASSNLLKNGNASKGLKYWKAKTGAWEATTEVDGIDPYSGKYFYPGYCEVGELYQDVSIKSYAVGTEFTLSAVMRGWNNSDKAAIQIAFLNKKGKEILSFQKVYRDNDWKTKKVIAYKPKGAVKLRVSLIGEGGSSSMCCDAYFDNVVLKKTNGKNLLQNGSGEYGTAGWTDPDEAWGSNGLSSTEHEPKDGEAFLWPSERQLEQSAIYQDVSIASSKIGKWITLSAWLANYDQAPHDEAVLILTFLDKNGKKISSKSQSQRNPEWQKHIITAKIPKGTKTARVTVQGNRYVGSDLDCYVDDIVLKYESKSYKNVKLKFAKSGDCYVGEKKTLKASYGSVTSASKFTWTSSYNDIATVNKKGVVRFLAPGEVTIYAKYKKTGVTGSITFTVKEK